MKIPEKDLVKVSSKTQATKAAGSIAKKVRRGQPVLVRAIGATANNIALKAVIIANNYLEEDKVFLVMKPEFVLLQMGELERTAINMQLIKVNRK